MSERRNVDSPNLFERRVSGHKLYSHAVSVQGGRTVYLSGQLARNKAGEIVGRGDMRAQLRQVGENLREALAAAGASLEHVVKITVFVTDIEEFFRHVDVRAEYFGKSQAASSTVEVRRLAHPDFLVEIEAVAVV